MVTADMNLLGLFIGFWIGWKCIRTKIRRAESKAEEARRSEPLPSSGTLGTLLTEGTVVIKNGQRYIYHEGSGWLAQEDADISHGWKDACCLKNTDGKKEEIHPAKAALYDLWYGRGFPR